MKCYHSEPFTEINISRTGRDAWLSGSDSEEKDPNAAVASHRLDRNYEQLSWKNILTSASSLAIFKSRDNGEYLTETISPPRRGVNKLLADTSK